MKLKIKHNFNELSAFLDKVERQTKKAMSSALNKSLNQAKTKVAREVTQLYGIQIKYTKRDININRPNSNKLYGSLIAKGKQLPLNAFKVKFFKGGLNFDMGLLGVKTVTANTNYSTPFKAKINYDNGSEYSGIWSRYNNKYTVKTKTFTTKQGIKKTITGKQQITKALYTVSVPSAILNNKIVNKFNEFIINKYNQLLTHEIQYFSSKL